MNGMLYDNNYIIRRSFSRYFIPSFLAILGGNVSIMIDNLIAGNILGSTALAAMSIVSPVFFVITTLGGLINGGASTIASVAIGKNDDSVVNQCFTFAVILTAFVSFFLSLTGTLFLKEILALICREPMLLDMATEYCFALIPGAVCIMAVYTPLNFFRIEGRARYGMIMFLIMSGLDIILDLLFVVYFDMGMFGLGLATVLSAAAAVFVCFPFLLKKGGRFRFAKIKNLSFIKNIFATGSPLALTNFYSVVRIIVLNACLMSTGGSVAIAAFSFANSVNMIAHAIISGVSQTVSPLTGVLWGEKDISSVKKLIIYSSRYGLALIIAYIVFATLLLEPLCTLFGLTFSVREAAGSALLITSASFIPAVINSILVFYFMTIEKITIANKIAFGKGLLFSVASAFILSAFAGVNGVWFSFIAAELLTLIYVCFFSIQNRNKCSNINVSVLDAILHTNTVDIINDIELSFAVINQTDAVMESSGKVTDFCERCHMSPRQSMLVSLSIEEILLIMTAHAFTDKKEHYIDVRIVYGDTIVMRFRCDGTPFNPLTFYQNELADTGSIDFGDSLGINMLLKLAKKIDYTTTLGLNNLIVEI